ncbi:MAG: Ig-like domain-containing protein, partial [Blastocatellia bacterium]
MNRRTNRSWSWLFFAALIAPFLMQSGASGQRRGMMIAGDAQPSGLVFRLSEGAAESATPAPAIAAPRAEGISDEAAASLLRRLPPIRTEGEDEKEFALRDRSLPPPRTGQTINESFPPASASGGPGEVAAGPLEVLRFAPEGEVPLAPHLSITFSQPMVPVTAIADLAAASVPVKLTPQPAGRWRWVGTKTLLFEPVGRFPMASSYTAEIPAGTKSATGGTLGAAKRWTFATPPPRVTSSYPTDGPHSRNPVFFVEFDQRIESAVALKSIRLEGGGRKTTLRLATAKEIESDPAVRGMKSRANDGCWIAFRAQGEDAERPLGAAMNYVVTLDRGLPSAEGPRATASPQTFAFHTYHPLELTRHECGGRGVPCEPGWPWSLQFNNALDPADFDPGRIRVEPEIPGVRITNFGNMVQIQGATRGRTTYRVTVDAAIKDVFGQTMGTSRTVAFNVASAAPNLGAAAEEMTVLDPYAPPGFSIFTVNHSQLRIALYAATVEHWSEFAAFMGREAQGRYRTGSGDSPMPAIGRLVSSKVISIANKPDDLVETRIDLKPALPAGVGHVILSVEAVQPRQRDWERRSLRIWIQSTGIGLDAFADPARLLGWASSLRDGKPLDDVRISMKFEKDLAQAGPDVRAGADGLARMPLPTGGGKRVLLARRGNDTAILPENFGWWDNGGYSQWARRPVSDSLRWHVFDDRGMYRPGEEARIKGWLRRVGAGPMGDIGALQGAATTISYVLRDPRGNEILKGEARLNALGGFDASLKLPPTINLGQCWLALRADGGTAIEGREHTHRLVVQEFRRPEYEVKVEAGGGPWFVGDHATLNVMAGYYAGGGLGNAEVNWNVVATAASYTPPNRGDFTFGKWRPWWDFNAGSQGSSSQQYQGRTDASGSHRLRIDFDSIDPPQPTSITAHANVQDVNRQNISGRASLLVHPSAVYVGLRSPKLFVQKGEPLLVESIVTDLDGKALANREIRMRAVLLDWAYEKGEWRQVERNPRECIVKSAGEAVECRFQTSEGGRYRVTARVIDDRERPNESELTLWVAGGKQPPQRDLAQEKVELIPTRKEYAPGETAELLLQSPFYPAEGVMTLSRSGMVTSERFTVQGPSHTLKIPIQDAYTPNVYVKVDLAGAAVRQDEAGKPQAGLPKRPAFASGSINLSIPPTRRRLSVTAVPREPVTEPGAATHVDVRLRDADGKPVAGGEVALIVVDEAVLALSNYQLLDPIDTFYSPRGDDVTNHHLREKVQLATSVDFSRSSMREQIRGNTGLNRGGAAMKMTQGGPQVAMRDNSAAERMAPMAQMMAAPEPTPVESGEIRARLDFNALANFAAALPTDAEGRARVDFKLPDNLTRYRIMAVAVAGDRQ